MANDSGPEMSNAHADNQDARALARRERGGAMGKHSPFGPILPPMPTPEDEAAAKLTQWRDDEEMTREEFESAWFAIFGEITEDDTVELPALDSGKVRDV